jgi:hypothetical protein
VSYSLDPGETCATVNSLRGGWCDGDGGRRYRRGKSGLLITAHRHVETRQSLERDCLRRQETTARNILRSRKTKSRRRHFGGLFGGLFLLANYDII